jgi:F-type H+-transporting ATPase subunit delta
MRNRITPYQYAIFLYELFSEKGDAKKKMGEFIGILKKNNDVGKIGSILKEFDAYEKKQNGVRSLEVVSARPISKGVRESIKKAIKGDGEPEIKETIDPSVLGGLVLISDDMMIDGTFRKKIIEFKKLLA